MTFVVPNHFQHFQTQGGLLMLLVSQLTPSVQAAIEAGERMLASEGRSDIESTSAFLLHAASAVDHFYPGKSRRKPLQRAFPHRASDMRLLIKLEQEPIPIPAGTLTDLDQIRNDLVHVDERVEEQCLEGEPRGLTMWGVGSGIGGPLSYMYLNREAGILYSLGRSIDIRAILDWLREVLRRLSMMTFPLMLTSHALGAAWPGEEEPGEPSPEPGEGPEGGSERH